MGKNGGARPGAGRPKGAHTKVKFDKSLLEENSDLIINNAIMLATKKEPNIMILSKLLDKLLPSLSSSQDTVNLKNQQPLASLSEEQIKSLLKSLVKVASNDSDKK